MPSAKSIAALSTCRRADDIAPLKVTMLPSVAIALVDPAPGAHSHVGILGIDVQVIADPRLLDLRAEGIDLAIRFGRTPPSSYACDAPR